MRCILILIRPCKDFHGESIMHTHNETSAKETLNAWLLSLAEGVMHRAYGRRKRSVWGDLPSTIVEVGAGAGANFRYYPKHATVIGIEPNPAMHPHLRSKADRHHLNLDIRGLVGEQMDLPDGSADAVVGTLVLCSVTDPDQVLSEIRRILRPMGRYIFLEHVAAVQDTPMRSFQEYLKKPWHWLFDGCHLNRDTHMAISRAGFASVDMDCFKMKAPFMPFAPHIFGVAVN